MQKILVVWLYAKSKRPDYNHVYTDSCHVQNTIENNVFIERANISDII